MSWITVNIGRMTVSPRGLIKIGLWFSILTTAAGGVGAVSREAAAEAYEVGIFALMLWLVIYYLIPALWTLYELRESNQRGADEIT